MKTTIFLILLFSQSLFANSIELITGGLTYHVNSDPEVSERFSNKLTSDGSLIYNQLYGFRYTKNDEILYDSYTFFMGHNSINEQMGGFVYSFGIEIDSITLGFAAGGYYQDSSKFTEKGIGLLVGDFMPVFGVELNKKFMINKTDYLKLNSFFSPVIVTETFSVGEEF